MTLLRALVAVAILSALLGGCGIFGCSGAGGNGGFAAGCGVGTRF